MPWQSVQTRSKLLIMTLGGSPTILRRRRRRELARLDRGHARLGDGRDVGAEPEPRGDREEGGTEQGVRTRSRNRVAAGTSLARLADLASARWGERRLGARCGGPCPCPICNGRAQGFGGICLPLERASKALSGRIFGPSRQPSEARTGRRVDTSVKGDSQLRELGWGIESTPSARGRSADKGVRGRGRAAADRPGGGLCPSEPRDHRFVGRRGAVARPSLKPRATAVGSPARRRTSCS